MPVWCLALAPSAMVYCIFLFTVVVYNCWFTMGRPIYSGRALVNYYYFTFFFFWFLLIIILFILKFNLKFNNWINIKFNLKFNNRINIKFNLMFNNRFNIKFNNRFNIMFNIEFSCFWLII